MYNTQKIYVFSLYGAYEVERFSFDHQSHFLALTVQCPCYFAPIWSRSSCPSQTLFIIITVICCVCVFAEDWRLDAAVA